MSAKSRIEWTEATWNPVTGCTRVSPGCDHCYAETLSKRFGLSFEVTVHPERLAYPRKWRRPLRIFVNSMSDLFHPSIPDDYLRQIWGVMVEEERHTFQVLTKRPHRMVYKVEELRLPMRSHIWLGTSVESQVWADNRIPPLLTLDCDVRFLSCEPLLGFLDLRTYVPDLDWVIAGGESGAGRRPMEYSWAMDIRDQCVDAVVPFFYKQGNGHKPGMDRVLDGRTWDELPGGLVRAVA